MKQVDGGAEVGHSGAEVGHGGAEQVVDGGGAEVGPAAFERWMRDVVREPRGVVRVGYV